MSLLCKRCNRNAEQVTGRVVYPHRKDLYTLIFWQCPICYDYVGSHKVSGKPLGELAGPILRTKRAKVHKLFDPYWKSGYVTRTKAYRSMANFLNILPEKCHIGMFDEATCDKLLKELEKNDNT